MSLSERIRPDVEAAPWVIVEVAALEAENATLKTSLAGRTYGHDNAMVEAANKTLNGPLSLAYNHIVYLEAGNARYREALEEISELYPTDNSTEIVVARGIARGALKKVQG